MTDNHSFDRSSSRLLRIPLEYTLIKEIDSLIVRRVGGYTSRQELIRDATEAWVLELSHAPADEEFKVGASDVTTDQVPLVAGSDTTEEPSPAPAAEPRATSQRELELLTLISSPEEGVTVDGEARVDDDLLFGLHNRDYPSIWVLRLLADSTRDHPVLLSDFIDEAIDAAWILGRELKRIESSLPYKLTALFPTNEQKRQGSEDAFREFAIGGYSLKAGELRAWGPLYVWKTAQLVVTNRRVHIAPTVAGLALLRSVAGLSLPAPPDKEHARAFLDHLHEHSYLDWRGFRDVLDVVSGAPTREQLIMGFQSAHPDWKPNVVSTNAAGYLARCREWGLVKPVQAQRRYLITEFGQSLLSEMED